MNQIKILYVTNIPSPYRVSFFNELSKHCSLTVVYERRYADDRDRKWVNNVEIKHKSLFLKGVKYNSDFIISFEIREHLKTNQYDYIVFCDYASPTGIVGISFCIKHNIDYYIESDGAFYKKKIIRDIIKRKMLKHSSLCFSTNYNLDCYYNNLGVNNDKIVRYRFTSLHKKDICSNSKPTIDKSIIKKRLGIDNKIVLLFIGQFIYRKGLDLLLKSFSFFCGNICLLVVGGSPTKDILNVVKEHDLCNVLFYNFKTKEELDLYYRVADYFILPTREDIWGLVVNEALSYGLPVLTTDRCNAGLELIKEGYNGYIVKHNSVEALTEGLKKMLSNKESLRDNCIESIKEYTIENMVKDHMDIFSKNGK